MESVDGMGAVVPDPGHGFEETKEGHQHQR